MLIFLSVIINRRATEAPKGKHPVSPFVLVCRGLAAAIAIGIAVWLSGQGQPLIAGIAAVFPAIFLTSMVALWMSQGPTVPRGAAGPMMLGGASVAVYAIVSIWSLPQYGVLFGSVIAWIIAVVGWSIPAYIVLSKRNLTIDSKS
jgi:peptidoglycan/LPS O-acetylase OafA/YrhL